MKKAARFISPIFPSPCKTCSNFVTTVDLKTCLGITKEGILISDQCIEVSKLYQSMNRLQ